MDSLKAWLVNILIKTGGESAIRGGILGLSGYLVLKNNVLTAYGIVTDAAAQTTTIHWNQLPSALIPLLPALGAMVIKILNTHAVATVTGAPQDGTHQRAEDVTPPPPPAA